MKNLLVLLIITVSWTAQAQQPASCLKLSRIKITDHLLHQAGETRAELLFKTRDCYVVSGFDRPTMTLEDMPGLQVALSSTGFSHIDPQSVGTAMMKAREMSVSLDLKASPGLPLGEHSLHAMVSYQRLDSSGAVVPETIAIQIPFKVAPPRAPQKEKSSLLHGLAITGEIIVGIPLFVVMMIWCPISGTCPSC